MNTEEKISFLYKNRLLRAEDDIEGFDEVLAELNILEKIEYLGVLFKVFDDKTEHSEVMYGLVHAVESFYEILGKEASLDQFIKSSEQMKENAFEWLQILLGRIFNDEEYKKVYGKVLSKLDYSIQESTANILCDIKNNNPAKFEDAINKIFEDNEELKRFYQHTKPASKKCAEYFLSVLEFYSHYNPKNKICIIGIDLKSDYDGLFMAINFEPINKLIQNGTAKWDESMIVSIDLSSDKIISKYLHGEYSDDSEVEKYLRNILHDTVEELAHLIPKGNYNCNSEVLMCFNLHNEYFEIIKTFKFQKQFQENSTYIDNEINKILSGEEGIAKEILLSMSIKTSPKRIIEDLEKIYYKSPMISLYSKLAECYEFYNLNDSYKELIEYTILNTYFRREILFFRSTLDFILKNKLNSKIITNNLRQAFEAEKLERFAMALVELPGEDISTYFRLCPNCNTKLRSKRALQCSICKCSWHKCPKCNEPWERDTSKCKHCGYDLYKKD